MPGAEGIATPQSLTDPQQGAAHCGAAAWLAQASSPSHCSSPAPTLSLHWRKWDWEQAASVSRLPEQPDITVTSLDSMDMPELRAT